MNEPETAGTASTNETQDVRETFSEQKYEMVAADMARNGVVVGAVYSALRIAANVMRPGFLESELPMMLIAYEDDHNRLAGYIRKALLGG